jgi:hypothetical protein
MAMGAGQKLESTKEFMAMFAGLKLQNQLLLEPLKLE